MPFHIREFPMTQLIVPPKLKIALIVATDTDRAIGKDNQIPWKHKADMANFRQTTTGHIVLMGRNTFESMGSKPLPKRHNLILSSSLDGQYIDNPPLFPTADSTSIQVVNSAQAAVDVADMIRDIVSMHIGTEPQLFVIGGQSLYELFLPYAGVVYHNVIETRVEGADTYFPEMAQAEWLPKLEVRYGANGGDLPWRRRVYERRR